MPKVGEIAPDFSLPDQTGTAHKLSDYLGHFVLLYFYPKDDTPGCTTEACSIRDNFSALTEKGIKVLGVSTDSVKSHLKFDQKYNLEFTLLADAEKEVVNQYGVWGEKTFIGRKYLGTNRVSFLIDPTGKIIQVYPKVDPETHVQEVLKDIN